MEFSISGIVKDVSTSMTLTFSYLWIPFTSIPELWMKDPAGDQITGSIQIFVQAKDRSNFDAIKKEVQTNEAILNSSLEGWEAQIRPPLNNISYRLWQLDYAVPYQDLIKKYLFLAFLFLLVPAVNLSGLTSSRMQDKKVELGIRKAFGAKRGNLITQVLTENLLMTLLGGMVGLLFSFLLVFILRNSLLGPKYMPGDTPDVVLSVNMLMNYTLFLTSLLICLILNVLSSIIPVWNASGKPIMESINDN